MSSKLPLTLACWNYDRTRALQNGRVQVDGIDLRYLDLPVEETFFRMIRHREFDVAEMSLSSYTLSMFREPRPFVAIAPPTDPQPSVVVVRVWRSIRSGSGTDRRTTPTSFQADSSSASPLRGRF